MPRPGCRCFVAHSNLDANLGRKADALGGVVASVVALPRGFGGDAVAPSEKGFREDADAKASDAVADSEEGIAVTQLDSRMPSSTSSGRSSPGAGGASAEEAAEAHSLAESTVRRARPIHDDGSALASANDGNDITSFLSKETSHEPYFVDESSAASGAAGGDGGRTTGAAPSFVGEAASSLRRTK